MKLFAISEVLAAIGVQYPEGRSQIVLPCPCCDKEGGRHLGLNLEKGLYNCPRCGVHGGIIDLYGLYKGLDRDASIKELLKWREGAIPSPTPAAPAPKTNPTAPRQVRANTYGRLLLSLPLMEKHRKDLIRRGLREEELFRYRSVPKWGTEKDIAKKLLDLGCTLEGVPGFFKLQTGEWAFVRQKSGFFIPAMDSDGYIVGMQVRLDDVSERKYRWLSSSGYEAGAPASAYCHVSGPVRSEMLLTEGVLKADIITAFTERSCIAVPGVNALTQTKETLEALKPKGLRKIWVCYDMDMYSNPRVMEAYQKLLQILDDLELEHGLYKWDPAYKGLDDYLAAKHPRS